MLKRACAKLNSGLNAVAENQLALMAALLLEASIRHFSLPSQSGVGYVLIWLQLLAESTPLLLAHYVSCRFAGRRNLFAAAIWCSGFMLYPILLFTLAEVLPAYASWSLFSVQCWLLLLLASSGYGLSRWLAQRSASARFQLISRLFSLNSVLILLMTAWAVVWAGIFASTDDPVRNQPLQAVIDSETIIVNFGMFLMYLWQFLLIGSSVLLLCWVNRYWLIRKLLAQRGVFAYVAGCLVTILLLTPLLGALVLTLPMNITEFTFLPSQDHNIFAPDNYRFCFFVLLLSAPVILAFERQQQETALAEVAQRQSQTELQLLQQQVNPHFLFNTLNNLYALTLANSAQAPNMVMQLANLLRYTVYDGQSQRVTLAQEVQYLQDFLALQRIRSADKCQLYVSWPEHADRWYIAPLLLIIVLENAFKHGVEPSQSGCHVELSLTIENGWLQMRCANSVPDTVRKAAVGVGLDNLRRRLNLLYAGKHSFSATQQAGVWCTELTLELQPC
ncbi:sensor histidine kinase [Rheinheimera sp. YQF-2]|uniref:Sensor histidine kinase n=1 Tax=Rheinheimera lutimaris TaxID=2740584 RepID=A0A7Y5EGR3_9GAMM|nr:sensor histidine kinase [Rheinheimera lutimaris]NRQ41670.1 sensor histidine kinase [Rheinheimera lutimaris]